MKMHTLIDALHPRLLLINLIETDPNSNIEVISNIKFLGKLSRKKDKKIGIRG